MINAKGDVLYVGKAKNLRKRVTSYTRLARQANRTRRMVMETVAMEFVTTRTEAEALLLEADFIKRYRPRYNILLRDDKSFPSDDFWGALAADFNCFAIPRYVPRKYKTKIRDQI